jgi:PPK2 family polyphosphate:nucleotide phosphotransferase
MKLDPVTSKRSIRIDDKDARVRGLKKTEKDLERATEKQVERICELQRVLYADARYAILVVFQGRDASGKDGATRKVFRGVNSQGCGVASFRAPTDHEQLHDFLWRVHRQVPERGMIRIFNRSHYEDVIVPRVHDLVPKKVWSARYEQINEFERLLAQNSVVILKFFLHISRAEQKRRLLERITDETKNWKFREGDLDDRVHWDRFTKAYRGVLANTSTRWAPWYVVPADNEDVRDLLIARRVADTLARLDLKYPKAEPALLRKWQRRMARED